MLVFAESKKEHTPANEHRLGHDFIAAVHCPLRHFPEMHELFVEQGYPDGANKRRLLEPLDGGGDDDEHIALASPSTPMYPGRHGPQVRAVVVHGCRFHCEHDCGTEQSTEFRVVVTAFSTCTTAEASLARNALLKPVDMADVRAASLVGLFTWTEVEALAELP